MSCSGRRRRFVGWRSSSGSLTGRAGERNRRGMSDKWKLYICLMLNKHNMHRTFAFWSMRLSREYASILHNRRACSALQGIGGRVTNKQSAKVKRLPCLGNPSASKTLAFPIALVTMGKISRTVLCLSFYVRSRKLFAASHCNVRFTQVETQIFCAFVSQGKLNWAMK